MLDQCIEGLFGTFKLLKSSYKYSYSNIGWLWNKKWNKDLISTIFWFLSPTSLFTYAKIDFEPFTYNLYFFHVCTIFCSVFLPFFDPSIKHTPLGNVMALMFGQCISFITMIFSFLSIKEHTLHFIKLINRSWNTMPSAHGILATHLVQNFLVLSHDFFVTYPWVDFFFLQGGSNWKSNKLIIGGYGSWSWKSCNPIVAWKKKRIEGSKVIVEEGIMGLGIPIGLGEEMG